MAASPTFRTSIRVPRGTRDWLLPLGSPPARVLRTIGIWLAGISDLPRGFDWPGNRAETHLLLGSLAGEGVLETSEGERKLGAGDFVLSPAGLPRRYRARSGRWRLLMVRLAPLSQWEHLGDDGVRTLPKPWLARIQAPIEGMLAEEAARPGGASHTKASRDEEQDPKLYLLSHHADRMGFGAPPDEHPKHTPDAFSLYAAILRDQLQSMLAARPSPANEEAVALASLWSRVRERPDGPWTTQDLAVAMGVSRATLHRLVRRYHASGPGRVVESIRMEESRRMLLDSRYSIGVIAEQMGYATAFSFSAAFKRVVGVSPSGFREKQASQIRVEPDRPESNLEFQ